MKAKGLRVPLRQKVEHATKAVCSSMKAVTGCGSSIIFIGIPVQTAFDVVPGSSQHVNLHTLPRILKPTSHRNCMDTRAQKDCRQRTCGYPSESSNRNRSGHSTHLPLPRESAVPPTPYHILGNRVAQTTPAPKRVPTSQQARASPKTSGTLYAHTPQSIWPPHPVPHRPRLHWRVLQQARPHRRPVLPMRRTPTIS